MGDHLGLSRPTRGRRGQQSPQVIAGLLRAVDVLDCLTEAREPLGVAEVARRTGLHPATAYRILYTLGSRELVAYDPHQQRYRIGPRFLQYGARALGGLDVRRVAQPYLERLQQETQETAVLCVRVGFERIYVEQVESPQEVRQAMQLGAREPLCLGASGKAILAHLSADEIETCFQQHPLPSSSLVSRQTPEALRTELAAIRTLGYAVSRGDRWPDTASVAAPIFSHLGEPMASLVVCGPLHRLMPQLEQRFCSSVKAAAEAVSRMLGYAA